MVALHVVAREPAPRPTMLSTEVAYALNYLHADGTAHRKKVYRLARAGVIPPPINSDISILDWRWSRAVIEAYCAGQWAPPRPTHRLRSTS